MHGDESEWTADFPPSNAALAETDRRSRRLFLVETPLGVLMLVVGVLGGSGGSAAMWVVAACGAGITGIGGWALLRYGRSAADRRCSSREDSTMIDRLGGPGRRRR